MAIAFEVLNEHHGPHPTTRTVSSGTRSSIISAGLNGLRLRGGEPTDAMIEPRNFMRGRPAEELEICLCVKVRIL